MSILKKVVTANIIRYYNSQDLYHREDGPAVEHIDGYKAWYINGLYHRLDGPAIEYPNGDKYYYLMDIIYFYEEWLAIKDFPLLW